MDGIADWKEGVGDNAIQLSFKRNSIIYSRDWNSEEDCYDYYITIINELGKQVDVISDSMVLNLVGDINRPIFYKKFEEIFDVGYRKATKADKILDDIIETLKIPF